MMNKVAQFYRELVATLTERLRNGERDIDALVEQARARVTQTGELTRTEVEEVTRAVRRDWRSSREAMKRAGRDRRQCFMRVIKESLWQELADITDKTQLEWREVFRFKPPRCLSQRRSSGAGEHGVRSATTISPFIRRRCCRCVEVRARPVPASAV